MKQTVIIEYTGITASPEHVKMMKDALTPILQQIAEDPTISIATISGGLPNCPLFKHNQTAVCSLDDEITASVIYIGELFADVLTGVDKSYVNFVSKLTTALLRTDDNKLKSAVEILSTYTGKISAGLAQKYGFTKSIVQAIRQVYNATKRYAWN